jgi:hypothetical protein
MSKVDSRVDLWAGRMNAKRARMTQSKFEVNAHGAEIPVDRFHYSAVPTSAKQVELRVRHEAALSLADKLSERVGEQKIDLANESSLT